MKYTRKFEFFPSWESRSTNRPNTSDLYEIPPFNWIAMFLNKKGWEIDSFRYIEDTYPHYPADEMKSIELYCSKETESFVEEKTYSYWSSSNNELSFYNCYTKKREKMEIDFSDCWL